MGPGRVFYLKEDNYKLDETGHSLDLKKSQNSCLRRKEAPGRLLKAISV